MPTIKERIFTIVKDNPGVTQRELATRLKDVAEGSIASQVHDLVARGVLFTKHAGKVKNGRALLSIYTDLDRYELMPVPKAAPAVVAKPVAPEFSVQAIIDPLTMGQARQLYKELHRIFGAK